MRGSVAGSVESSSNTRPSSGLGEALAGKLTVIWAVRYGAVATNAASRKERVRGMSESIASRPIGFLHRPPVSSQERRLTFR